MRGTLPHMTASENNQLTEDQVRKVAHLARLALDDDAIRAFSEQLSTVLEHIARINALDVQDVEPMAHPLQLQNRLAEDVPVNGMSVEQLLENAPAVEGDFIAVPKVLGGES